MKKRFKYSVQIYQRESHVKVKENGLVKEIDLIQPSHEIRNKIIQYEFYDLMQ